MKIKSLQQRMGLLLLLPVGLLLAHTNALMERRMELGGTQDPFETALISESIYEHVSGEMDIKTCRSVTAPLKGIKSHVRLYVVDNKGCEKEAVNAR
jgi:hypothetical protein